MQAEGIPGLPVRRSGEGRHASLWDGSASVVYLQNRSLLLSPLGSPGAEVDRNEDDVFESSCVDKYGNARPLFVRGRVFALLRYALVEGGIAGDGSAHIATTMRYCR